MLMFPPRQSGQGSHEILHPLYGFSIRSSCEHRGIIKYSIRTAWEYIHTNAFSLYTLSYDLKDSTETLHRKASLHRLAHRRWLHMLVFIFNYIDDKEMIDIREIHTRRREGVLFKLNEFDHYKVRQDPKRKAMNVWNGLPVYIRNARSKEQLKLFLKSSIVNPYKKTE